MSERRHEWVDEETKLAFWIQDGGICLQPRSGMVRDRDAEDRAQDRYLLYLAAKLDALERIAGPDPGEFERDGVVYNLMDWQAKLQADLGAARAKLDEAEARVTELEAAHQSSTWPPPLTLSRLQSEHREWSERNFGAQPSWVSVLGVMEELGELAHSFIKRHQGIRTNEDHDAKLKDAVGDVVIFLASFCSSEGIDMQTEVEKAWAETSSRDWKSDPRAALSGEEHSPC